MRLGTSLYAARHNRWQGIGQVPRTPSRHGISRYLAPNARLLRPCRGRGLRGRGSRAVPRAGGRDAGQLPGAPDGPAAAASRRRRDEIDDIFADEPDTGRRTTSLRPVPGRGNGRSGSGDVTRPLRRPRSFNDVQDVADKFKDSIPVILNLQGTDTDLVQAADRLLQRPDLRPRRRHAADRRQGVPAHAAERRGVRRGAGAAHREGVLQPVMKLACAKGALALVRRCGWTDRSRQHGARDGAWLGRAGAVLRRRIGPRAGAR